MNTPQIIELSGTVSGAGNPNIGLGAALLAGLLSFFSPCVLPLIPVYISLISGISVEALKAGERTAFWPAVSRTAIFIGGFSLVFTSLGAGAGAFGQVFRSWAPFFRIGGGLLVFVFGLHLSGILPLKFLYREKRFSFASRKVGALGAFLMGMTFAIGWTPCVGPILAGILALAVEQGQAGRGTVLLLTYSAGLGIPFLLAAAAMGTFLKLSGRVKKVFRVIEVGSGLLLIVLGVLLLTNRFSLLAQWFARIYSPTN